jgi:D-cysteine desulfhydrase
MIKQKMDEVMNSYIDQGFIPYYIYGGGHTFEGGKAYIDAVGLLKDYCNANKWYPDYIFLASGTGSTQSGILAGLDKIYWDTKVIGISVGRNSDRAVEIVDGFYKKLCNYYEINCQLKDTTVLDDYLCGGYGKYNDEIKTLSMNSLSTFGFTLDTCYSGKAFYGMQDYIRKNKLQTKKILFWHTGGVLNYLAE